MKIRSRLFEFPVFGNYGLRVIVARDLVKAQQRYPQTKNIEETDKDAAFCVHVPDEIFSFMFLKPNASSGTIAHETWHVVHEVMRHIGAELDNEVVGYYIGHLVDEIQKFVKGK